MADPGDKPSFFVRYRVAVAAGALILALILAALLATPVIVRGMLKSRAQQMGVLVEAQSIRLGWGAVWLRDVRVTVPQMPSVSLQIDSIRVVPSLSGRVKRVQAAGGVLDVKGSLGEVNEQRKRWRDQTKPATTVNPDSSGVPLEIAGLQLRWSGLVKDTADVFAWGLRATRESGVESVGFDLARVVGQGILIEAKTAQSTWKRSGPDRVIDSIKVGDLIANLDLEKVPALFADGAESPSPKAPVVESDQHLSRLHRIRDRLSTWVKTGWGELATLQLPRVQTRLQVGEQVLNIGPGRCTAQRDLARWTFSFIPGANASQESLAWDVQMPLQSGATVVSLIGGPVGLDVLGVQEGDFGLQRVHDIRVSARSTITLPDDRSDLDISADGQLERLSFLQPKLAREVVNADRIGWSVRASWKPQDHLLQIPEARVELGQVKARLNGELKIDDSNSAAKLSFEIPLVSCQSLFDSVPASLLPTLRGTQLGGTFSVSAVLDLQVAKLKEMKFNWTVKNDCRIAAVPSEIAPERFRQPFQYQIVDAAGLPLMRESGPLSRDWVSLDQISPHLESAVVICEDSRFFSHHGIDEKAIESALVANVQAGRFVRGASTISMQLAKNLYLGHEKTLSRKLQEAVLTVLLEQELTKHQILELYFNVIEFGPDVWGIRAAADYYFGIEPKDLSLGQSLYLGSLLPNPHDPHAQGDGTLTPRWAEYMKKLMQIAHKIKRIDDQELEQGLQEVIRVGLGRPLPPLSNQPSPTLAEPSHLPESLPVQDLDDTTPPTEETP